MPTNMLTNMPTVQTINHCPLKGKTFDKKRNEESVFIQRPPPGFNHNKLKRKRGSNHYS